ncbi:MAG: amidase family protein, partial [Paracoccaceae bacterium]
MSANGWTIAAARDALHKKEVSAVDLTMACLTAMDAGDALNTFVHKTPELALEQARAADARLVGGDAPDLCGIPLGVKDLYAVKGVPTQAGSNILRGFKPEYESTVTSKLWEAGAVCLGKLNMDEFAMGSSNESSCYGPAVNPWKVDARRLTPGGSSG